MKKHNTYDIDAVIILKKKVIPNLIKCSVHESYVYVENDIIRAMEEYANLKIKQLNEKT